MSGEHFGRVSRGRRVMAGLTAITALVGTSLLIVATPPAQAAVPGPLGSGLARAVATARAEARPLAQSPRVGPGWTQENEIVGPSDSGLGFSVAVSRSTMVVGAAFQNSATGAAYVYTGSGTSWTEEAELTAPGGQQDDLFGSAVAIRSGIIAVGAECHSATGPTCEGATYIYTGSGANWTLQTEIDDPGAAANDSFGGAVAVTSNAVLVGAAGENTSEGAVFIYTLRGHSWALKSEIQDPALTANDGFGWALAVHGKSLVAGAPGNNGFTGTAYVFGEVRGGWVKDATLTAANGGGCSATCGAGPGYVHGDSFGTAVATSGRTIVIGSPYASVPPAPDGVGTGAAYVFQGSGTSWSPGTELSDPAEVAGAQEDYFGFQVALSGSSVAVGAPLDNDCTGAVFVFPKVGGTWPTTSPGELTASDGAPYDCFGYQGLTAISSRVIAVGASTLNGNLYFFEKN
jgi:hypothetical protein